MTMPTSSIAVLPGYEAQLAESGVTHSVAKLNAAAGALRDQLARSTSDQSFEICEAPCSREDETLSYRCRVTFQLLCGARGDGAWEYAMRTNREAVSIGCSYFPIASKRIQETQTKLLQLFNGDGRDENFANDFTTLLSARPASISFASSWADDKDIVVTINYTDQLPKESSDGEMKWLSDADKIRRFCKLTSLTGRSRKRKLVSHDDKDMVEGSIMIRDTVTICCNETDKSVIDDVIIGNRQPAHEDDITIQYAKPEDAFQHPNGNACKMALKWILNRITLISNGSNHDVGLLEMYCGCGAHTVPIAKVCTQISYIACVEIDERLIMACQKNLQLNQIDAEFRAPSEGMDAKTRSGGPVVQLFRGDAGEWATRSRHQMLSKKKAEEDRNNTNTWYSRDYTILLVDPPRAGLSANVCRMAIEGKFQHLIYISCGKEALLRDIEMLNSNFEIADCTLIDLFPRTDAVESLVHLRRRKK